MAEEDKKEEVVEDKKDEATELDKKEEVVEEEEEEEGPPPGDVAGLKSALAAKDKQIKALEATIKGLVDVELEQLSDEDKQLVTSLAGKSPAGQLKTLNALKAAGKIGAKATETNTPPKGVDRTRVASQEDTTDKPKTWADADRSFSKKVRSIKR